MQPFYRDDWLEVWQGDCRAVLAGLEPGSVHCVVTSPPYWALRDYGTATWEGGSDPACDHKAQFEPRANRPMGKLHGGFATVDAQDVGARAGGVCRRCGAIRVDDQIGLEATPDVYVDRIVEVFREVRRVLRDDGTLWLNLGDSYAATGGAHGGRTDNQLGVGARRTHLAGAGDQHARVAPDGLKPKDLVGIPWRVALALRADGWYLRRDVIWSKPNPMPESVEDRPTSSHEYLFLLTKSERYFYDNEAVREPATSASTEARWDPGTNGLGGGDRKTGRSTRRFHRPVGWNAGATEDDRVGRYVPQIRGGDRTSGTNATSRIHAGPHRGPEAPLERELRSVWTIATDPYPGAHYATFPRRLVVAPILAGTPAVGVCPECGAPWQPERIEVELPGGERVMRRSGRWLPGCRHGGEPDDLELIGSPVGSGQGTEFHAASHGGATGRRGLDRRRRSDEGRRYMFRWQQRELARQLRDAADGPALVDEAIAAGHTLEACRHWMRTDRSGARCIPVELLERWIDRGILVWPAADPVAALPPVPAVVLDPFAGSGTVGLVAQQLGRRAVLIDLNGEYLVQAMERNAAVPLPFASATPTELVGAPAPTWQAVPMFEEDRDAPDA